MTFWTTLDVPAERQIDHWRDVLCEAFISLDASGHRGSQFRGSVAASLVSDINVARVQAEEHRVIRGESEIRRTPLEYYFVNMQVQGEVCARHQGREVLIRPNEFYMVDSTEPYDLKYRSDQDIYSFRIPKGLLDPLLRHPRAALATRVSRDTPMGRLAVDFLQSVVRQNQSLPMAAGRSVAGMIAELVALSLADGRPTLEDAAPPARQTMLDAILLTIDRTLMNPELSVKLVCTHFRISERYLHRLFEVKKVSFGQWVLHRRLERCANELVQDPGKPVSSVAFGWGFSDISYFNHSFRKRFGTTPRAYRATGRRNVSDSLRLDAVRAPDSL